jgi:hypothetical protein
MMDMAFFYIWIGMFFGMIFGLAIARLAGWETEEEKRERFNEVHSR